MNEVIYYGLRAWVYLRGLCCTRKKEGKEFSSSWEIRDAFNIETRTYSNGLVKRVVHPYGSINTSILQMNLPPPPPWFFIGCYDSAKSLEDKTYEMDEYIYPGNTITLQLLQHLFPGTQRWVYIHPQTFDETEFPSEGIAIE